MRVLWPMGAKKIDSTDKFEELMRNDRYIGQEKLDGVRALLHIGPDGYVRFTTRGATLDDPDTPIEITHRLPHLSKYRLRSLAGCVLDGELIGIDLTSAEVAGIVSYKSSVPVPPTIEFFIFDILYIANRNLTTLPLSARLHMLSMVANLNSVPGFYIVPYVFSHREKDELLNSVFAQGKEGIVLKNLSSPYHQGKKKSNTWYKVKKHDTVDVIITGAKPPEQFYRDPNTGIYDLGRVTKPWGEGWLGSIAFKFNEGDSCYEGFCAGITDELRAKFSDSDHGIKPEYVGMTMEVEYMERTKDGNLRHPRFVRLRHQIEK